MRAATRSPEVGVTLTTVVVVILSMSAITSALKLEAVFGALVAGILINAAAPVARERVAPYRPFVMAVLAPLFFAIAGLRMDLGTLADPVVLGGAVVLLVLAILGKFAGAFLGSWLSGLNRWEMLAVAAGMNARGVVGVIVASVGLTLGVITTAVYTIIVGIAILTSLMGPPILRFAAKRIEITEEEQLRLADQQTDFQPARVR
jgi:Kef-type K+ transport system membrane component KefB